jgi:hypothetical protein
MSVNPMSWHDEDPLAGLGRHGNDLSPRKPDPGSLASNYDPGPWVIPFEYIARDAGFEPQADGKFNLPATQETADRLAAAAAEHVGKWTPGTEPPRPVTLTGAAPVWAYLVIAHALHGRVPALYYAAPNAPRIKVFGHGA